MSTLPPPSNQNQLLTLTPPTLHFTSILVNTSYASSFRVTSNLQSPCAVTLSMKNTSLSRKFDITPSTLTLQPNSSAGVNVTLKFRQVNQPSANDIRQSLDSDGKGIKEYVVIKGDFFTQSMLVTLKFKVPGSNNNNTSASASASNSNVMNANTTRMNTELQNQLATQNNQLQNLENSLQTARNEQTNERLEYEERSSRVLKLLHDKDLIINNLKQSRNNVKLPSGSDAMNEVNRLKSEVLRLQEKVVSQGDTLREKDEEILDVIRKTSGASTSSDAGFKTDGFESRIEQDLVDSNEEMKVYISEMEGKIGGLNETVRMLKNENEVEKKRNKRAPVPKPANTNTSINTKEIHAQAQAQSENTIFIQTSKIIDLELKVTQQSSLLTSQTFQIQKLTKITTEAESSNSELKSKYEDCLVTLKANANKANNYEIKVNNYVEVVSELKAKVVNLEHVNETAVNTTVLTQGKLQEALSHIESTKKSGNKNDKGRVGVSDFGVNAWWIHIANDAKNHPQTDTNQPALSLGGVIAKLRQDLLTQNITHRQTLETCTSKLHSSQTRIESLEHNIKTRKTDGETKLRELETSLRLVKGRGDLHALLSYARQELASERVSSVHLKGELELNVKLLYDEKARHNSTLDKLEVVQDEVDCLKIVKTIEGIPGIEPLAILRHFAGAQIEREEVIERLKVRIKKGVKHGDVDDDDDDIDESDDKENVDTTNHIIKHPSSTTTRQAFQAVELQRLTQKVKSLESQIPILEAKTISSQNAALKQTREADHVLRESSDSYKRSITKLERKLAMINSERDTLKCEIDRLQIKEISMDSYVRESNAELERTKQRLNVTEKLVHKSSLLEDKDKVPEISTEVARLQSLLDERNSQVAVLMESVEALQTAFASSGSVDHNHDNALDETTDSDNSSSHLNSPLEWGIQAISKRVISLTTELSSATSVSSMMERRAEQLTREVHQRNKLCTYLEAKLKVYEEELDKHGDRAQTMADEHNRLAASNTREISRVANENNGLRRSIRETEVKLRDAEMEQNALTGDCSVLENTVSTLRAKIQDQVGRVFNITDDEIIVASNSNDETQITTVVEQFIANLQQMRSSAYSEHRTPSQDDQIFGWVTDIVIKTDAQCVETAKRARQLQMQLRKCVIERDNAELGLEESKTNTTRLQKRLDLADQGGADGSKLKLVHTEASMALLEARVKMMQEELLALSEKDLYICAENRSVQAQFDKVKTELVNEKRSKSVLLSDLKQTNMKARIEAQKGIDAAIKESESKIRLWFESELPNLYSGKAASGKQWNDYDKYDDEANAKDDAAIALSQALTTTKSVQVHLEVKLAAALESADVANSQIAELQQNFSLLQVEANAMQQESKPHSLCRLWELYAPTGSNTASRTTSAGEPNPNFQNLMQEVDTLRMKVNKSDHAFETSEQEKERMAMWLNEARKDAENAQEQLTKRVTAIRAELESRHGKEVSMLAQRSTEQHQSQIATLGQLRSDLLKKENELQDTRLRLQLFGAAKDGVDDSSDPDLSFQRINPIPAVQTSALVRERDFLIQKVDKLIEEMKLSAQEKFELEAECERLLGNAASMEAEASHANQDLSVHRSAFRALEESITASLIETVANEVESEGGSNKPLSTPILARSLTSAKLAEAEALQKLQRSAQNEVRLRMKVEECERSIKVLKRLSSGVGRGDGKNSGIQLGEFNNGGNGNGNGNDSVNKLRARVSTQASAIAYLELRIAQLMAEQSADAGNSAAQNLRRDLQQCRDEKAKIESELSEARSQLQVRGKLALTVLDTNTTRFEGDKEVDRMKGREKEKEVEMTSLKSNLDVLENRKKEVETAGDALAAQLHAKEKECSDLIDTVAELKANKNKVYTEYKSIQEKMLTRSSDVPLDIKKLKERPLFTATDNLYNSLSLWLERLGDTGGDDSVSSSVGWEDMWHLVEIANKVRQLSAVSEELPTNLASGMEELSARVRSLQEEINERDEAARETTALVLETAEDTVRAKGVEAINELRAQVMLMKKKVEEGDGYRDEIDAEQRILKDAHSKSKDETAKLRSDLLRKTVQSDEEISTLRTELVKLRKGNWEGTSSLRSKYDAAIKDMEDTAQYQDTLAQNEVARLELLLEEERARVKSSSGIARAVAFASDGDAGLESVSKVADLQALLGKAADEATLSAKKLREFEEGGRNSSKEHDSQVTILREQFARYREAQEKLVTGLNTQLRQIKTQLAGNGADARVRRSFAKPKAAASSKSKDNDELLSLLTQREDQLNTVEMQLKRMQYEYKLKVEEAEAARDSVYSNSTNPGELVGASIVERAILEAKFSVNELELKNLLNEVGKEKEVSSSLRRELAASVLQTAQVKHSTSSPQDQTTQAQLAEVKRAAKVEINKLKSDLDIANSANNKAGTSSGSSNSDGEILELKKKVTAMQQSLTLTREDLSRKTKIVMNLRASRATDENSVSQWKGEVQQLEEKLTKARLELGRRENLMKDMREKLEKGGGKNNTNTSAATNDDEDNDENERMKATMNLDKNRLRQQITTLKSKIDSQNDEISKLEASASVTKSFESKVEILKASLVRKDSILNGLKAQMDAARNEFVEYKNTSELTQKELEKRMKAQAKKLENTTDSISEKEEEGEMRVSVLEESKVALTDELRGIKSSLFTILGDLYNANSKARGSPQKKQKKTTNKNRKQAEKKNSRLGSMSEFESLDQASIDKIGSMLDLTKDEMSDIFAASEGGRGKLKGLSAEAIKGARGKSKGGGGFMETVEHALNLSGESSIDVDLITTLGRSLLDDIVRGERSERGGGGESNYLYEDGDEDGDLDDDDEEEEDLDDDLDEEEEDSGEGGRYNTEVAGLREAIRGAKEYANTR